MKKKPTKVTKDIQSHVKLHFVIATIVFFAITLGFSAYGTIAQLRYNDGGFGGASFYLLATLVAPLLCVLASYFLVPKNYSKLDKTFWTILIAFVAILLNVIVQQATMFVPFATNVYSDNDSWMISEAVRMGVSFIPVVAYFGYLYWLKQKLAK